MEKLIVSTSPHFRGKTTTASIMRDVLIALTPAVIASVVFFGFKALLMIAVCVGTAVTCEFLFNLICKKKQTVGDLSAIVTGLILALNLPQKANIWHCVVGSAFAIIIVKCVFGGIGHNFANPAATARVFLLVAFSSSLAGGSLTRFAAVSNTAADAVSSATPLEAIKNIEGELPSLLEAIKNGGGELPSLLDMLLGNRSGAIGETCVIAIILGFLYLVIRRVIKWYVPAVFVGTVFVFSLIYKQNMTAALYQVMGGGLLFGAVFMATDYSSTPITNFGKVVFAFGCGIITCLIRFFGDYPEGVSFAILLMNILAPIIEKITAKRPFGGKKKCKKVK